MKSLFLLPAISLCFFTVGPWNSEAETPSLDGVGIVQTDYFSREADSVYLITDYPKKEISAAKKKGKKKKSKKKNTLGTYSGTFVLKSSKSFNGANCTPTDSFPAVFVVSGSKAKPTGQLGNIPVAYSGRANKKGAKLKGKFSSDGINRSYTMLLKKVKSDSANLALTEIVKSGKTKACRFIHSSTFTRSAE